MREHPILFSSPMVRAILAGTKTMTRRVMKPQPRWEPEWGAAIGKAGAWIYGNEGDTGDQWWVAFNDDHQRRACTEEAYGWGARAGCPYGVAGDKLWVKETFTHIRGNGIRTWYRADGEPTDTEGNALPTRPGAPRWRPSIFMSRHESRITLEVTDVRVERLQSISEEDAKAEGVQRDTETCDHKRRSCDEIGCLGPTHRSTFCALWDEINGKRATWQSNPWVWVVSFRRLP